MVVVAQLVRASVCGTEGRGFEPHLPPKKFKALLRQGFFCAITLRARGAQLRLFDLKIDSSSSKACFLCPITAVRSSNVQHSLVRALPAFC